MKNNPTPGLFPPEAWEGVTDQPGLELEQRFWDRGCVSIAGVDEAGRGCLAGPVVAAAVILPIRTLIEGVNDSKVMTPAARAKTARLIEEQAVALAVGSCSAEEIDELNILWAAMEAMTRALDGLAILPDFALIDGNTQPRQSRCPVRTVVKGDARSHTIAAASIIAKTHRDGIMAELDAAYPVYGWATNMGYPTASHYEALKKYGPSPCHRRTFRLN